MKTPGYRIRFGPVTVAVEADASLQPVLDALRAWLPADTTAGEPAVRMRLHAEPLSSRPSGARVWIANGSPAWWDGKAWDAVVSGSAAGKTTQWDLYPHESATIAGTRFVPDAITSMAHAHALGRAGIRASAVLYGHLLPAAQMALLAEGATLVHASSLAGPNETGILVLGWGGAGKTSASTSLYFRQPDRWKYMSDDLAIVSRDGTLFRSPVPMNVFPYNTDRFPQLEAFVHEGAGLADKLHWDLRRRILGRKAVARRFAPIERYLGPDATRLTDVVELERRDIAEPTIEASDAARVATEARRVLAHELARGFNAMRELQRQYPNILPPYPQPEAALDLAADILRAAMSGVRATRITLPQQTPPDDVGRLVERVTSSHAQDS